MATQDARMKDDIFKDLEPIHKEYLNSLEPKAYLFFKIAYEHMGSSFDINKSNGFINWYKTRVVD